MAAFFRRILNLAFIDRYPLRIRDVERVARLLVDGGSVDNEQVKPWEIITVAANGDVTSFSPDFMELRSAAHNNFHFGNILRKDFDELLEDECCRRTAEEIRVGVEACRDTCRYFDLCGGGSPSNKMAEHKSLASTETLFCRLSIQAPA